MIFTLIQLTNQTKDIFHLKFPIFKLQDSWQLEILSKLSLFELDSKAALARWIDYRTDHSMKALINKYQL